MKTLLFWFVLQSPATIDIEWTKGVGGPPIIGYSVFRGPNCGAISTTPLNAVPLTVTQYADATAVPGARYCYVIRSVGMTGLLSPVSLPAAIVLPADLPPACILTVTDLVWPAQDGKTGGNWNANQKLVEAGFKWTPLRFEAVADCGGRITVIR